MIFRGHALIRNVTEDTLLQGPANLTGPTKYVPLGTNISTLPEYRQALFHAASKAWKFQEIIFSNMEELADVKESCWQSTQLRLLLVKLSP